MHQLEKQHEGKLQNQRGAAAGGDQIGERRLRTVAGKQRKSGGRQHGPGKEGSGRQSAEALQQRLQLRIEGRRCLEDLPGEEIRFEIAVDHPGGGNIGAKPGQLRRVEEPAEVLRRDQPRLHAPGGQPRRQLPGGELLQVEAVCRHEQVLFAGNHQGMGKSRPAGCQQRLGNALHLRSVVSGRPRGKRCHQPLAGKQRRQLAQEFHREVAVFLQVLRQGSTDENDVIAAGAAADKLPAVTVMNPHPRIGERLPGERIGEPADALQNCRIQFQIVNLTDGVVLEDLRQHSAGTAAKEKNPPRCGVGKQRQMHEKLGRLDVGIGKSQQRPAVGIDGMLLLVAEHRDILIRRIAAVQQLLPLPLQPMGKPVERAAVKQQERRQQQQEQRQPAAAAALCGGGHLPEPERSGTAD